MVNLGHTEYRYRVAEIYAVGMDVAYGNVREYKSYEKARKAEKRMLAEGRSVLFQTGRVDWLTPEELAEEVARINREQRREDT